MYIVRSGELAVSKLGTSGRVIRMAGLGPGDFFGEMTLIEMQNRSATVGAESPTVLYELTARNLYAFYKADIHAYVMVILNMNRELCRRLRRADNRIAELADAPRESTIKMRCSEYLVEKRKSRAAQLSHQPTRRPEIGLPLCTLRSSRSMDRFACARNVGIGDLKLNRK